MEIDTGYSINEKLAEKSIIKILNALGNGITGLSFKEIERKTELSPTTVSKETKYLLKIKAIEKQDKKYRITSEGITLLHKLPTKAMIERVPLYTTPISFGKSEENPCNKKDFGYTNTFGGKAFVGVNVVVSNMEGSVQQYLNGQIGSLVAGLPQSITEGTILFTFNRKTNSLGQETLIPIVQQSQCP